MDPLGNLRDIHLPEPVSWWPPAPGWWVLALLAFLLLCALLWQIRKQRRRSLPRREALRELGACYEKLEQTGDRGAYLREVNRLLKQVALNCLEADTGPVQGDQWLQFLDRTGGSTQFSRGEGKILAEGPYVANPEFDPGLLHQLCQKWIKQID